MGTNNIPNAQDILYLLMFQNGTQIISQDLKIATFNLSKDTSAGIKDIPGKRAFDFYTSFADPASANYSWNDTLGNTLDAFASGKIAMMFGYNSLEKKILETYPNLTYRKSYAPQLGQEQYTITDFAKFNAFGVNNLSPSIALAWSLNVKIATDFADSFATSSYTINSKVNSNATPTLQKRETTSSPAKIESPTAKTIIKGRNPVPFDRIINEGIIGINSKATDNQSINDLTALNATAVLKSGEWQ